MEVFAYTYREFSHGSDGERILKIGPHLPSYYHTLRGILFGTQCILTEFGTELKYPSINRPKWPNSHNLKIQDGGGRG